MAFNNQLLNFNQWPATLRRSKQRTEAFLLTKPAGSLSNFKESCLAVFTAVETAVHAVYPRRRTQTVSYKQVSKRSMHLCISAYVYSTACESSRITWNMPGYNLYKFSLL